MLIVGVSCYYHDSAACLIENGQIIAAAQEERFTRKKHDASFLASALKYCLQAGDVKISDLDAVVYYEKPLLTFERLLETYLGAAPRGGRSFVVAMQVWLKEKLFIKSNLKSQINRIAEEQGVSSEQLPALLLSEHHLSHAGAAFFQAHFMMPSSCAWTVLENGLPLRLGWAVAIKLSRCGK